LIFSHTDFPDSAIECAQTISNF